MEGSGRTRVVRSNLGHRVKMGFSLLVAPPDGNRGPSKIFLKDMTPLIIGTNIVRISIWDTVSIEGTDMFVKDVLKTDTGEAFHPIWNLIESRI